MEDLGGRFEASAGRLQDDSALVDVDIVEGAVGPDDGTGFLDQNTGEERVYGGRQTGEHEAFVLEGAVRQHLRPVGIEIDDVVRDHEITELHRDVDAPGGGSADGFLDAEVVESEPSRDEVRVAVGMHVVEGNAAQFAEVDLGGRAGRGGDAEF